MDGSAIGGLLWDGIPGIPGSDAGGDLSPTIYNVVVDAVVRQ